MMRALLSSGLLLLSACAHHAAQPDPATKPDDAPGPMVIVADPPFPSGALLERGEAAEAREDWPAAARYLGVLPDRFPNHPRAAEAALRAGRAHVELEEWEFALERFQQSSAHEASAEAALGSAQSLYHLGRFTEAYEVLEALWEAPETPWPLAMRARVEGAVCALELDGAEEAEALLRETLSLDEGRSSADRGSVYIRGQAHFFLGERFRLEFEESPLPVAASVEALSRALEHKARLLLEAQGHYLASIEEGATHWATAAGTRIGGLYETLHGQLSSSPAPEGLDDEGIAHYQRLLRERVRVLLEQAVTAYEQTALAAERLDASGPFIDSAREGLERLKRLLADYELER